MQMGRSPMAEKDLGIMLTIGTSEQIQVVGRHSTMPSRTFVDGSFRGESHDRHHPKFSVEGRLYAARDARSDAILLVEDVRKVDFGAFVVAAAQLGLYWSVRNRPPPKKV
jgi:hypothetical protein